MLLFRADTIKIACAKVSETTSRRHNYDKFSIGSSFFFRVHRNPEAAHRHQPLQMGEGGRGGGAGKMTEDYLQTEKKTRNF